MRILVALVLAVLASRCSGVPALPLVGSACTHEYEYAIRKSGSGFNLHLVVGPYAGRGNCNYGLSVRRDPKILRRNSINTLDEVYKIIEKETAKQTQAQTQ